MPLLGVSAMQDEKMKINENSKESNQQRFPIGSKGVPFNKNRQGQFSLVKEEVSLPAAVIDAKAIENNIQWMQTFADQHNVKLCPHGKTTMTPALFKQQLEHGAWGVTVATSPQAEVAVLSGAKNIIIANQVIGKANMQLVIDLIKQNQASILVCVDSVDNIQQWHNHAQATQVQLPLLIEMGVSGGRCGCRTAEEVRALAKEINNASHLSLAGIELYEGVIHGEEAEQTIRVFLDSTIALTKQLFKQYPSTFDRPIITGAGSAWYDVVAEQFSSHDDLLCIIRPGCYAIHDTGIYEEAQSQVLTRSIKNKGLACDITGDLSSSLELWAYVASVPETNKAVIGLGKRDAAFDAGLPQIERVIRNSDDITLPELTATHIMDQHMFVEMKEPHSLKVGDIVVMSTSHPCLTFDKWRYIGVKKDNDIVSHWVDTYF